VVRCLFIVMNDVKALLTDNDGLRTVFILKFVESFSYFATSQILTLYLSEEFGYSDVEAGVAYGIYGAAISLYGLVLGKWIDSIGIKKSLMAGFFLATCGRTCLSLTGNIYLVGFVLFVILPVAGALGIPVLLIGMKRNTNEINKAFAFGLFYTIMNVGALCCGPTIDLLNWFGYGHRVVFAISGIASIFAWYISFSRFEDCTPPENKVEGSVADLFKSPNFVRFMALSLLLTNVRAIFRHLDATLPKYLIRKFGPQIPKGFIYAINPLMIILCVPVIAKKTAYLDAYGVILLGSLISSFSPFFAGVTGDIGGAALRFCSIHRRGSLESQIS